MISRWRTVKVLLSFARKRSQGRTRHQQALARQKRGGKASTDWGAAGLVLGFLFGCAIHGAAAIMVYRAVDVVTDLGAEKRGFIILGHYEHGKLEEAEKKVAAQKEKIQRLGEELKALQQKSDAPSRETNRADTARLAELSRQLVEEQAKLKGPERAVETAVESSAYSRRSDGRKDLGQRRKESRAHYERYGSAGFRTEAQVTELIRNSSDIRLFRAMGTTFIVVWFFMLAFQGEGMEVDFQRRRHPMWEWLLSHPVRPGAVFAGEMLAPLAANPFFLSAPVFWIILYLRVHDGPLALLAGLVSGVAVGLAACCFSKALEIAALVRLPPRSRGAALGILSWIGYTAMFATIFLANAPTVLRAMAVGWDKALHYVALPPLSSWVVGAGMGDTALWKGVMVCFAGSAAVIAGSVAFSAWATNRGLAGVSGSTPRAPMALGAAQSGRWLRDPLHRKELLWFWRDRGAVVQVILIPLTMVAFQVFNFRGLMENIDQSWHVISGLAVLVGTYFLFILGPRSLLSEGPALWIPLTWPRGLENLLKAKARLWWAISTALVTAMLAVAGCLFPADLWRIALVALGWFLFSGSLAEKTVTLVTVASSSGEAEPVPRGRRWAAMLGTFTFAIGVLSQQWSVAFVGVVFSWITSAAMWQNLRARLPYLFDPWSEKLPQAPTLMHAMVAISAMLEVMSIITVIAAAIAGFQHLMFARALGYGIVGTATWLVMDWWLGKRGVKSREIWIWSTPSATADSIERRSVAGDRLRKLAWPIGGGVLLGLLGCAWQLVLPHLPGADEAFKKTLEYFHSHPAERYWMMAMAVVFAPLAEEYLFRGLLYRALDREWGGWRAMGASALFFAIYHPPLAWVPVGAVGLFNAYLFKRTGKLMPCVVVHAIYNLMVTLAM